MTSTQQNLRLPSEVEALLTEAHRATGGVLTRHRLAVVAMARGLRAIIDAPARILEGITPPAPPFEALPPPALGERAPSSSHRGAAPRPASVKASPSRPSPGNTTRRAAPRGDTTRHNATPGDGEAEELDALARDLAAHRTRTGESVRAIVASAGLPSRSHLTAWLEARARGEAGTLSAKTRTALRAYLTTTTATEAR